MARRKLPAALRRMAALTKKYGSVKVAAAHYRRGARNDWKEAPTAWGHRAARYKGLAGKTRSTKKKRKYSRLAAAAKHRRGPKRKSRKGAKRNYQMMFNPGYSGMMFNRHAGRKRRKGSTRRRVSRRGARRNPGMALGLGGITKPIGKVFSMEGLATAGWVTGGAFATLTIPQVVRRFLPANGKAAFDRWNQGIPGILITGAAAGIAAGLASAVPMTRRRAKEVLVGGLVVTLIKAGTTLLPQFWPITLSAKALPGLGMGDPTGAVARSIESRALSRLPTQMSDYDTGLEDFDTGLEDYDTGMEDGESAYSGEGTPDMSESFGGEFEEVSA